MTEARARRSIRPLLAGGATMSANVDSVKAMYECFGRGDVAGILARLDPDIEWEHDWGMPPPWLFQKRRGR